MSKVRLTKEQATAIEKYKNDLRFRHWQEKVNKIRNEIIIEKCLLELSTDDFMNAFEYGYEVEPEFNVGDWIFNKQTNVIFKLEPGFEKNVNSDVKKKFFRHATPEEIAEEKERRFFAKHDRAVWELWDKDLLKHKDSELILEVQFVSDDGVYLNHDSEARSWDLIKRNYLVACFYSDRKDVDNE